MTPQIHQTYIADQWLAAGNATPNPNPSDTDEIIGQYAQGNAAELLARRDELGALVGREEGKTRVGVPFGTWMANQFPKTRPMPSSRSVGVFGMRANLLCEVTAKTFAWFP